MNLLFMIVSELNVVCFFHSQPNLVVMETILSFELIQISLDLVLF